MDTGDSSRKRKRTESFSSHPSQVGEHGGPTADCSSTDRKHKSSLSTPCAKWCHISTDGQYHFNAKEIRCFMPQPESQNEPLGEILCGRKISGQVWPLIFGKSDERESEQSAWLRSIPHFDQILERGEDGKAQYAALSIEQKRIVGVGIRDLYLAVWLGIANNSAKTLLEAMVNNLDEGAGCLQVRGMKVSFYPTAGFKALMFSLELDQAVDADMLPYFAQIMETPRLFAVFIDPSDLSYHNFENIVPLDRWIDAREKRGLALSMIDIQQISPGQEVFSGKLQGRACKLLKDVSGLGLYTTPLNKATRGGERFIFHSARLSKALGHALWTSGILDIIGGGRLESSFEFVNYVFRCNRFSPGDGKFSSHLDTPYYDSSRSHVSKYTVLIYLTSGQGNPALRISDLNFGGMDEMTCIVFDQSLEHEGQPFIDTDKVFIRTELVFKDKSLTHNPQIGSLFSSACYFTAEAVFKEELAAYAHECFERANSLHWALEQKAPTPPIYLHKCFQGLQFITNGYDYWFKKDIHINAADCALVAFLDFSNTKIDETPFRALCTSTIIRKQVHSTEDIWLLFNDQALERPVVKRLTASTIDTLVKTSAEIPFTRRNRTDGLSDSDSGDEYNAGDTCCYFHAYRDFDAWKSEDVWVEYRKCWRYTRRELFSTPFIVFGQELHMNKNHIVVKDDKVYFLRSGDIPGLVPLNFAACWAELLPENMITTDREITAPELLLPPVLFHEYREGWHLVVDLFKNDWMVNADKGRTIKVPVISNDLETGTEKKTFWEEIGMCQDDVEALGADLDILEGWSVGQPRSDEDDEEDSETDHSSNTSKTEDGSYVS